MFSEFHIAKQKIHNVKLIVHRQPNMSRIFYIQYDMAKTVGN
jgi:hypothetical protein